MASLYSLVDWLTMCLRHGLGAFVIGWAALAIYYATAQPAFVRVSLACAFTVFGLWALWYEASRWLLLLFSGLSNSCTVNIVRYAKSLGRGGSFNIRHYLNGLFDGYLYTSGRLDTTMPFAELRRRSRINDAARAADGAADFSARIRDSLPRARRL